MYCIIVTTTQWKKSNEQAHDTNQAEAKVIVTIMILPDQSCMDKEASHSHKMKKSPDSTLHK